MSVFNVSSTSKSTERRNQNCQRPEIGFDFELFYRRSNLMARNAGFVPVAVGIWEEARSLRDWFRGPSLPGLPSVCKVSLGNSLWPHRPSDAPDKIREAGIVTAI